MSFVMCAARVALIALLIVHSIPIIAQTAISVRMKDSIAVTLTMEKEEVPTGQSPLAILSVRNLTGKEIDIHDETYRVYVEGDKGEPPTTLVQRQMTGRLKPSDVPLRAGEYVVWTIAPEKADVHKFQLTYLYDFSAPGQYSVYAEVMDPSTEKWLRTNTVRFKVQAVTQ